MTLNRRFFLAGASICAIIAASPADAWFPHGSATIAASFQGNPNTTISSISGSIFASQTTGDTPCFVQVSASSISCSGTRNLGNGQTTAALPYEDLEFRWNFGDPSGVETFTRPTDGTTVNANSDQVGPEAFYVYRSAGTYQIRVTVRGKNGSGYVQASFTQNITVTTFAVDNNKARYVDSVNGNDNNDGKTTGTAWRSFLGNEGGAGTNTFAIFMADTTADRKALYIARGTSLSGADLESTTTGGVKVGIFTGAAPKNWRIAAYGSGALPVLNFNTATVPFLIRSPGGGGAGYVTNIITSNIVFNVSDGWTAPSTAISAPGIITTSLGGTADWSHVYFDNVTADSLLTTARQFTNIIVFDGQTSNGTRQWLGLWKCSMQSTLASKNGIGFNGGPLTQGLALVGCTVSGAATNANTGGEHHIYPDTHNHVYFKWITFGATGTGANRRFYCINTNADGPNRTGVLYNYGYFCISENYMSNASAGHDASNAYNNPNGTLFTSFVSEKNAFANLASGVLTFACAQTMTVRDNRWWSNGAGQFYPDRVLDGIIQPCLYRNQVYMDSAVGAGSFFTNPPNGFAGVAFRSGTITPQLVTTTGFMWLPANAPVRFSSTGTLPPEITAGTVYYIKNQYSVVAGVNGSNDPVSINTTTDYITGANVMAFSPPDGTPIIYQQQNVNPTYNGGTTLTNNTVLYILNGNGAGVGTFQASLTPGGAAIDWNTAGSSVEFQIMSFSLSDTPGGTEKTFSGAGSGTISIYPVVSQPWIVTDNVIWDSRTSPQIYQMKFSDMTAANGFIDRNQYFGGAGGGGGTQTAFYSSTGIQGLGTASNFTTWQAGGFDANGSFAAPSWPCYPSAPTQWSDFGP